jgi:hypothetical protein
MKPEEIVQGVELRVPAGADVTRSKTYYAKVDEVDRVSNGYVHVFVTMMNAAGRIRTADRGGVTTNCTAYAIVNAELCSTRVPAAEVASRD